MNSAGTDYVNALRARDYKGIGNQDIGGGKLICQNMDSYVLKIRGGRDTYVKRDGTIGTAGKGALMDKELSFTVAAAQDQTLVDGTQEHYIVRRLTPKECERLQGFPDDWCSDVPHSDSAEYKLWGNGIALPTILPIMKSMADILRKGGD
jgi:DNA (cytosine-5)-methyltransferase 1